MVRTGIILSLVIISHSLSGQCPDPTTTGNSRCGTGTVELSASGSTGIYAWYDDAGNFLATGSSFTTPVISSTTDFYATAFDATTQNALDFDGSDDYVSLSKFYNTLGQFTVLTVEGYVNTSVSGQSTFDNWAIIDFDRSEYFNLYVTGDDGRVGFSTTDEGGTIHDLYSPSGNAVNDGTWHHVAGVYDGTDKIIYIDGVEVARATNAHGGLRLGTGLTRYGFIGDGSEADTGNGSRNNLYFQGQISEVRVWNVARSETEINNDIEKCVSGASNLEVYYRMDDSTGSSTLTDWSGNGFDGTLRNMDPDTDWVSSGPAILGCCESNQVVATATVNPLPVVDLGGDDCAEDQKILDPGAGFTSYLWQDGSTDQTFTVSESGEYWVEVSDGTCTNRDSVYVSIVSQPSVTDGSNCGPGNVTLTASGSTNEFYYWYDVETGGNPVDEGDTYITPEISSTTDYYVAEYDTISTRDALSFDGSDDHVAIQNINYNSSGIAELTVEAWIKTSNGGDQVIASFDRSEYWRLEINGTGAGTGQIGFDINTDAGIADFGSTGRVDDGAWHHVAAVFDNGNITIYIDGIPDNSTSLGSTYGNGVTRYGFIGVGSEAGTEDGSTGPNDYFEGELDEFRVWNIARTEEEINIFKDKELTGTETGLEVYYKMSDGTGSSQVTDHTGNTNHGTLKNMDPASDWITSDLKVFKTTCQSQRVTATATIHPVPAVDLGGNDCVQGSKELDAGAGYVSYLWQDNSTNQTLTASETGWYWAEVENVEGCINRDSVYLVIVNTPTGTDGEACDPGSATLTASGSGKEFFYWYDAETGGNLVGSGSVFDTPELSSTTSYYVAEYDTMFTNDVIEFDGNNDYIAIRNFNYASSGQEELTVETWIKTSDGGDQIIASYDRSEYWRVEVNGNGGGTGQIGFDIYTDAGQLDFGSNARIDDGNWHHIAVVFDHGDIFLYIDGLVDNLTNFGNTFGNPSNPTRYGFLGTGSEASTEDGSTGPDDYFNGMMDEFRIWSVARSEAEIQNDMNKCLQGDETGLEVYFQMDDGAGSSTLTDKSGNGNGGILKNMDPASVWTFDSNTIYGCGTCESSRTEVQAIIHPSPTNIDLIESCPGASQTAISMLGIGGTGNYDYREIGGAFDYSGTFTNTRQSFTMTNNQIYDFEVKDENNCTYILNNVVIGPSPSTIASSSSSGGCISQGDDVWYLITNGTNEIIAAVKDNGNALGNITAEVCLDPGPGIVNDDAHMARHFIINADNDPALAGAEVRFYFTDSELTDLQSAAAGTPNPDDDVSGIGDLGTTRYEGPTEDCNFDETDATSLVFLTQSGNGTEFSSNFIQVNTTFFSEFWLHASGSNSPLPVELISFNASPSDNYVELEWATATELNNDYFTLERSEDGFDFKTIAIISGAGDSYERKDYSYRDYFAQNGINYYRLRQTDFDGTTEFFNIVSVEYSGTRNTVKIFPNPANQSNSVSIDYLSKKDEEISVSVFSVSGNRVFEQEFDAWEGVNKYEIPVNQLINNVYIIRITNSEYTVTEKLIIN